MRADSDELDPPAQGEIGSGDVVTVHRGSSPVILGLPHTGTHVPLDILDRLNDEGRVLCDTDWHIDRLYDGLLPDATTVRATFHRYVVDANRDPAGASLYPGQNTTGLVPLIEFGEKPIWRAGEEPTPADIAARVSAFHTPYHAALAAEIERVRTLHGVAILYDCHSIRPVIPFLFDGVLPDFNIGTDDGRTCDPAIEQATASICEAASGYRSTVNGRFRGGWTTRHYGDPAAGVHAIQMELTWSTYLADGSFDYEPARAERLRVHLKSILEAIEQIAPQLARRRTRP